MDLSSKRDSLSDSVLVADKSLLDLRTAGFLGFFLPNCSWTCSCDNRSKVCPGLLKLNNHFYFGIALSTLSMCYGRFNIAIENAAYKLILQLGLRSILYRNTYSILAISIASDCSAY